MKKPITLFILLCILSIEQMWADEITVYTTGEIFIGTGDDAWDNDASTISVDLRYGNPECYDCDGFNGYYNAAMTKTAYTYNGYPIYSYTLDKAAAQFRFKHFKNSVWKENYTADWHSTTGQIYRGYWDDTHHWVTYGRDITIYAVPESMDGSKWTEGNTLKAVFKYGDQDSEKTDKITWTKTDYTYEGNYIYKCTFLVPYNVIKKINFYYNDGEDKDLYEIAWKDATQYGTNDIDGKIFLGWKNSSHTWVTYGRDITIYTVPETLFSDGKIYTTPFSTSTHTLKCNFKYGSAEGEWVDPMPVMTKTDWKYNNATIYKVMMLAKYNVVKQMAFQYFNGGSYINEYFYRNNNADFTDVTAADVDGKIYTGYAESAHHWETYATDITLDQQSGSGGTGSITATVGSAMPAITLPTRVGYAFGGYYSEADGGGTQYYNFDGSSVNNWVKDGPTTLYAKWIAVTLSTPTILDSEAAYTGEDITLSLSTTSTYLPEAMVIFYVTDNSVSKTYEVVATPGAIGDAPFYSTTHTATFKTDHPATYSVTAKVYSGKLIDNFDGALAHWKDLGGTFVADETNPAIQAGNGSNTVMQITRGDDTWKTVQTKKAANDETTTNWNLDYDYIYMSMYSTTARTPKLKYSDDDSGYEVALDANSLSANTWQRKQFATTHDIDYILPFMPAEGTMYIDDIILSNESSMTAQATSSSASTTITQPTIGSCTAEAATTNWGGSNINISLSAQTTYLADAVVVFFVTDGSNSTTYEVTATPGTPGANNAITHTATFVAQHAATYSVTAKLYNGKFIDNFEGSASAWSGLGYGTCERVSNVEREADNGSTKVMKITRSVEDGHGEAQETAWTTTEENSGTKTSWGHEYGYIHMRYYAPQEETPEVEYWDDGISVFRNTILSSQTASTWHELVFAVVGGVVNYIHPFVLSGEKTDGHYIYIDDIILSNRSTWAPIKNTSGVDLTADASDVTIREDYTVTLEDLGADEGHKGTSSVSVTYGATTGLTDAIDTPEKSHYEFGGYYVSNDGGSTLTETQLIDEDGNWVKDVTDYTGHDGDNATWLYADDITLYAKFTEKTNTFEGDVEGHLTEWNQTGNWSAGHVPTINEVVILPKPVSVEIAHAVAKRIIIDQSDSKTGKLTIQANKGLEVAGTITRTTDGSNRLATRAEDLILESDATGNASLVFTNSNSCAATVKMYSIGEIVSESQWNWQFMGTPFTSANALYSYYGSYLYEWNTSGDWDVVPNGGTMTPFTGYCITQDEPTTYVMDGTLNPNDNVAINIPASKEFVMANSWTAPISVHNFTSTTLPLADKTIYLFNTGYAPKENGAAKQGTAAGTYIAMPIESAIYTGDYLIAPMEGFYVDNTSGSEATITLKYDELVRPSGSHTDIVAGPMHAPKRVAAEAEPDVMKIKATGSRYADRVVILARQDFSTGFDNGWDGKNLNEPGVAPIIYALRADGTKDAVSAIPTYEGAVVGFRIGEDNNYTFSFNYDGEDIWYLNDLKEEKSTLIDAANTYSFVAEAGDAEARFIISATPIQKLPTGIGNDANDAMVKVRKLIINDQLFIIRAGRMYNAVGSIVK